MSAKKDILNKARELNKKEKTPETPKEIRSIDEALKEKEIRETQNLKIRLEQDRLCAEMMNMETIANILNSTSNAQAGCPINQPQQQVQYKPITCDYNCTTCTKECVERQEEVHPTGCHCSKCCPNPKPNWFKRNKYNIGLTILWVSLIILAIGWSPSGATFEAIQKSYVELIVNFFKMSIFAIAGVATYKLVKRDDK